MAVSPEQREIRRARPDDAGLLGAAQREIAAIPGRLAANPEEVSDAAIRDKIAALSELASGTFVVIEERGEIVGHAMLDPHKLAATSHVVSLTIAIHEGHQGKGLGTALMNHLIRWAQANPKVEKFELQVRSSNTRAINLYERLGFVEEGRKTRRLKYGPQDYQDDVYMALWVG